MNFFSLALVTLCAAASTPSVVLGQMPTYSATSSNLYLYNNATKTVVGSLMTEHKVCPEDLPDMVFAYAVPDDTKKVIIWTKNTVSDVSWKTREFTPSMITLGGFGIADFVNDVTYKPLFGTAYKMYATPDNDATLRESKKVTFRVANTGCVVPTPAPTSPAPTSPAPTPPPALDGLVLYDGKMSITALSGTIAVCDFTMTELQYYNVPTDTKRVKFFVRKISEDPVVAWSTLDTTSPPPMYYTGGFDGTTYPATPGEYKVKVFNNNKVLLADVAFTLEQGACM